MVQEKLSLAEILHKNRRFVLSMLGVPVIGMAIASLLIIYKKPDNMLVALGVILFVAMQYILMMFFCLKRVETYIKHTPQETPNVIRTKQEFNSQKISEEQLLLPEEQRILPMNEDEN